MGTFHIDADNFHWINGSADYPSDYCLHGHAFAIIGGQRVEYEDATVSATGLYLLKSLTQDHIIWEDEQFFPCCGFFYIPNDDHTEVMISGCPNGEDWSVIHSGDTVKLVLADGTEECLPLEEYQEEVFRFCDKIEAFYKSCTPKIMPEDDWERLGEQVFWEEWHRRRGFASK